MSAEDKRITRILKKFPASMTHGIARELARQDRSIVILMVVVLALAAMEMFR